MKNVVRALCALFIAIAPLPLDAQQGDAWVLTPGMVRLRGTAELSTFDSRFAEGGGAVPLGSELSIPLTSGTFAPLRSLEAQLNRFFTIDSATSVIAGPQTLGLGTLDVQADVNIQSVPLGIAVGVLPRLEVGLSVPLLREEQLLSRFSLTGGTVGANPAKQENADLLASLGAEWRALGASDLLPTDSSALGRELQRLVRSRAPGRSLDLPDSAATPELLNQLLVGQFGLTPLQSGISAWRVGDMEVSARFQLMSTLGANPLPVDSTGLHYRAALSVSARIPTGTGADSSRLLSFFPDIGQSGFGIGLDADVFAGKRFWTTLSLAYARTAEVLTTRRVVAPGEPLTSTEPTQSVRWSPADQLRLRIAPRYRLSEAISLGAQYSFTALGESAFQLDNGSSASVLNLPGGAAQSLGVGMRYTTLAAYSRGERLLPVEVVLSYEAAVTGPAALPSASIVLLQMSLFHRAWSRGGN